MPKLNEALAAIERHIGFPNSRGRTVAERLQDAGFIEHGAPAKSPHVDHNGFVALVLALASDATLRTAADRVRALLDTTPGGIPLDGAPASIGTARGELLALVDAALDHPGDLDGYRIEVVAGWPEIAIHQFGKVIARYQPIGALADRWQGHGHRKSTVIDGRAFRDAVRSIFEGVH